MVDLGTARLLSGEPSRSTLTEERIVCRYAETALRLAYPGSRPRVEPAPGRPEVAIGALRVTLSWPDGSAPLVVPVVIHDELTRAAWREAATAIGDAVRAELVHRCPAHPSRLREHDNTEHR